MSKPTLKELCEKATPGPWIHLSGERIVFTKLNDGCRGVPVVTAEYAYLPQAQENLQLIARLSPETAMKVYEALRSLLNAHDVALEFLCHDEQTSSKGYHRTQKALDAAEEVARAALDLLDGKS